MANKELNSVEEALKAASSGKKSIIPNDVLNEIHSLLNSAYELMLEYSKHLALTSSERIRLRGVNVRRRGFIETVLSIADVNPEFMPHYVNSSNFQETMHQLEKLQLIAGVLQQLLRLNGDNELLSSNRAYSNSLVYYNNVKEAARTHVPGAEAILKMLQPFFANMRPTTNKPTEKELLRDVKGLLHGTREGTIVVENENPKVIKGERIVVDNT